jgi:hypothetical protein
MSAFHQSESQFIPEGEPYIPPPPLDDDMPDGSDTP